MNNRARGLYEVLITEAIASQLAELGADLHALRSEVRPAEAADRLALHLGRIVQRAIAGVKDAERVAVGVALARKLIDQIDQTIWGSDVGLETPIEPGTVLRAVLGRTPDGRVESMLEPLIPLLDTTLLTNAPGEPRVGNQLLTELHSADRIDLVMAFIRRSGIAPLLDTLRSHCQGGRALRVLTTTYTGSTEGRALDALSDLGAEIRVSYDMSTTRLHAKAWLFHRRSGFSTAYIGSSNLTYSAQISGLEWNVRVSGARNPDVIDKVAAVFESYWNSGDFVPYDAATFAAETARTASPGPVVFFSPIEIRPEPFQERLLEQIALARERGHHRNLLVSATGTGKTVMAAIDYARLRDRLQRSRLLFVAHREEILEQSLATFRHCVRDHAFGELWVGGQRPRQFDHVFASIQSLNAAGFGSLEPGHFDVVIVDQFHHAAAPSYRALLEHVKPIELLGLTATPERSDGLPLLNWFDNRIAAELRLWDAIDQQRLSPFVYYGRKTFSDLRADAGLSVRPSGPKEAILRQACGRLLHIDDFLRIDTYRRLLSEGEPPDLATLSPRERGLARMLVASVAGRVLNKTTSLKDACELVWAHPQVRAELLDLIEVLATGVDHLQQALVTHPDVPLQVHARYSRIETLAAFGVGEDAKVAPWQTGVYWAKDARADLFAFTLDKTTGQFSPTTRYRDYAVSRDLIHWESQSSTRADSETGRRYQQHEALG